jgi:hypothetical protein
MKLEMAKLGKYGMEKTLEEMLGFCSTRPSPIPSLSLHKFWRNNSKQNELQQMC